jgi:hypothetical protein
VFGGVFRPAFLLRKFVNYDACHFNRLLAQSRRTESGAARRAFRRIAEERVTADGFCRNDRSAFVNDNLHVNIADRVYRFRRR